MNFQQILSGTSVRKIFTNRLIRKHIACTIFFGSENFFAPMLTENSENSREMSRIWNVNFL